MPTGSSTARVLKLTFAQSDRAAGLMLATAPHSSCSRPSHHLCCGPRLRARRGAERGAGRGDRRDSGDARGRVDLRPHRAQRMFVAGTIAVMVFIVPFFWLIGLARSARCC